MLKKPSLLVIFLTVFIDLIGFGIVLPLLPRYSERFGAEGIMIGLIIASFSVMQFFFAPMWGRLSDRIGRRPVLLISNAGSTLSYAMFALAAAPGWSAEFGFAILLASRIFAGICGANISVASAYIADITPADQRSKGMGLIGVSFGLGFIFGPVIGALSAHYFGLTGPGWVAATLCGGNFVLAWFILAESRRPDSESAGKRPKLEQWTETLRRPKVGLLIGLYFLATFCFACFESTLPLLLGSPGFHPDDFHQPQALARQIVSGQDPTDSRLRWRLAETNPGALKTFTTAGGLSDGALRHELFLALNEAIKAPDLFDEAATRSVNLREGTKRLLGAPKVHGSEAHLNRLLIEDAYPAAVRRQPFYFDEKSVGYLFAFCGLVSAFIQGGVIGRLVKRFGEPKIIFGSLVLFAASMFWLPYVQSIGWLLLALALLSAGSGLNRAPTLGLISIYSSADDQGTVMGVTQSAGTLARIFGPLFATGLYATYPHSPYLLGGLMAAVAAVIAWVRLCRRGTPPDHPPGSPAVGPV